MEDSQNRKSDIGLIGLAVMGENLVLNMESKGYRVSVYNRTSTVTHNFLNSRAAELPGRVLQGLILYRSLSPLWRAPGE